MAGRRAIGVDIGGTKIAAAVVDEAGTLLTELVEPTPSTSDARAVGAVVLDLLTRLRADHDVDAVGVGAAAVVAWPSGRILWAPNVAYRDWPIRDELSAATGLPVVVDNDANVAALAETRLGQPYPDMAMITVGTGIGGALVLGGRLYRGPTGRGGELGHLILDPDGPRCGCGSRGCFEALASGTALTRMARAAAVADPDGPLARLGARDGAITGHTVAEAVRQGDAVAAGLFGQLGRWLGVGIASLANILELDAVVVGGGLVEAGELLLGPARQGAREHAYGPSVRGVPPVVRARLGAEAGTIGAGLLALEHTDTATRSHADPDSRRSAATRSHPDPDSREGWRRAKDQ